MQTDTIAMNWNYATIPWQEHNEDGTKYALLEGVKNETGTAFSYAFFIPAGVWDAPHYHSATSRLAVLSGELRLGYGEGFVKTEAQSFEVGSYLIVPGGSVHYDGAEVDTVIIGTAIGPWSTTYL